MQKKLSRILPLLAVLVLCRTAFGSIALLLEEPYGRFGHLNPTGHAAIYLSNVCADTPTRLRLCRPGEMGVVLSRYHRVAGRDWLAVPLIPYLYAVEDLSEVPDSATPALEHDLRDRYRREHLLWLAPTQPDGSAPVGDWTQLVGASLDRRIYAYQIATTPEQDLRLINRLNDSRNASHFNLLFRNCADFSRTVLNTIYPNAIRRNKIADFGLTTPKQVARSLRKLGERSPELDYQVFEIPQVSGTIPRSIRVDGVAESIVRTKKYLLLLTCMSPVLSGTVVAAYVGDGLYSPPHSAPELPELQPLTVDGLLAEGRITLPPAVAPQPMAANGSNPSIAACVPGDASGPVQKSEQRAPEAPSHVSLLSSMPGTGLLNRSFP